LNKKISANIIGLLLISTISAVFISYGWIHETEVEVSNNDVLFYYGAVETVDDGFPIPPDEGWSAAVSAWRHPSWKKVIDIQTTLYDFNADWIWRVRKATIDEAKTGSIVFFKYEIDIPDNTEISAATIDITADNAYYLFISSEADEDTGPIWSGDPIVEGFMDGYSPDEPLGDDFYEMGKDGIYIPKVGAINTEISVIRSIENVDLLPNENRLMGLKPGMNWLSIVAINAQPQPKDKQTSQNTAGLIFKIEITYDQPLIIPDTVGFTFPLTDPVPVNWDYEIPLYKPIPIQAAWEPDINGDEDGRIDLVRYKPTIVVVNAPGATDVVVYLDGNSMELTLPLGDIFFFEDWAPNEVGLGTLTGTYDGSLLTPTDYEVFETYPQKISYYNLYRTGKKDYGQILDTTEFETSTTEFINATFPANVTVDETPNKGIAGAAKGKGRDAFAGLLADAVAAAQDAQLRMGGNAIGVAIGPFEPGKPDYFEYHGFPGAAGISFGPSVKGVIVLDGYWTSVAHEIGHTYGLYWGEPEQYQWSPAWGEYASGIWVNRVVDSLAVNSWSTGLDIMGVGPEKTLDDTWITTESYEELFYQMVKVPDDPEILLASGMIYAPENPGDSKTVSTTFDWIWMEEGFPNTFDDEGEYSLVFTDIDEVPLTGRDPVYFDAPFFFNLQPQVGTTNNSDDYGDQQNSFGAFAFATVWRNSPSDPAPDFIQIWDHTGEVDVLLLTYAVGNVIPAGAVAEFSWEPFEQNEGSIVAFTDESTTYPGDIVSWSWGFGDGGTSNVQNPTHTYYDDDSYEVILTVVDDYGFTDTISHDVTINNVAPEITSLIGDTISENGIAEVSGTYTDPGTLDDFTVTIDWGEGDPVEYDYPVGSTSFIQTHQYLDDDLTGTPSDVYTIYITVTDDDTGTSTSPVYPLHQSMKMVYSF